MSVKDSVSEMLNMQNTLNEMTNGVDWKAGQTALGKVINWRRCIVMETAELIDSYPWKHWKSVDAEIDLDNVRVELVDIWHFLLSLSLEKYDEKQSTDLLTEAFSISQKSAPLNEGLSVIDKVKIHETLMRTALEKVQISDAYLSALAVAFFQSCKVAELSFTELYQIYMAKNVLNKFRQDNGYKEGTYIKEWNGVEDNVVMFEIIDGLPEFSSQALYEGLQKTYQKLI